MRWCVNQRMAVLWGDELRLTPEESLGIARLRGCNSREQGAAMQAHEQAAGWLAGYYLCCRE